MILKNIKAVFLSNILIQIIGFIASFIIKRFIEPSLMGVWNLVNIVVRYILMLNSGVGSAAQREIPYLAGRNDKDAEEKTKQTFFAVIVIELFAATVLFYCFFFFKRDIFQSNLWYLFLAAPFYAFTTRIYDAFVTVFQAHQEFVKLSKLNVLFSVVNIVLSVAGALFFGITGLFVGIGIFYLYRIYKIWALSKQSEIKISIKFHWDTFVNLIKIGFPLETGSYFYGLFITIDSLLVAKWLGVTSLAFYSMGLAISRQMGDFPTQVNTIIFPRIMKKFGQNHNLREISKDVYVFFIGNLLIIIPFLVLFVVFVGPWLVRLFIRNYIESIPSLVILAFSMFFIPQIHLPFNIFLLKKQMIKVVGYTALNFIILLTSIFLINFQSPSLMMIAVSVLIGQFICFIVVFWDSMTDVLTLKEKIIVLLFLQAAFWSCLIIMLVLERIFPSSMSRGADTINMLIKTTLSFIICVPIAVWALAFTGTWDKVKDEIYSTLINFRTRFGFTAVDSNTEAE
ncbi:MAG: oligosaccharide flippase family protein [Candidatus Saganbacteria bacterium]|nr:oligosaccharide flippase family protein [Candidatus Saganbacteria bacterium]